MRLKNKKNIFIVDDNKIFSMTLKSFIENDFENSFKIHLFETGEKCLEDIKKWMPELVVLDYSLNSNYPGAANGIQVLDKIKKHNAETSVIMLTNNQNLDIALESFHHGASDYVVKAENQFRKIKHSITNIFAIKELGFQSEEKKKQAVELIIANKERCFKNEEKEKRKAERVITDLEFNFQNGMMEKQAAKLLSVCNQKEEVEKSKRILEAKNKDITDSINYAKRIQLAKLPLKEDIYNALPQSFVLFKPKDIVSGDFYFFHKNDQYFFVAAADCTGHGVPGAFMSMIGMGILDEAVALSSDTSEILKYLNNGIKYSLRQSENDDSSRDGMDIAICAVDLKNRIVKFAGANRPIWVIRNGKNEVDEIKGTKKAIGGYTENNQYFDSHEIKLQQGDTFYLFTDGYIDQFGGEAGKKLMTKKFKEILLGIQKNSMQEQKKQLTEFIEGWKAGSEQVDDILIIGVRL